MTEGGAEAPGYTGKLAICMVLIAGLNGVLWVTGFKDQSLRTAVEQGAAQAERRAMARSDEETARERIRTQRETLPFWRVLTMVGDFLVEPLLLAGRAIAVATVFSALAALSGRQARFDTALTECVLWQRIWVLDLAVHVVLKVVLRESEVQTSLALLLPPGNYPIAAWTVLQQMGILALSGWLALAWHGWRRKETGLITAFVVCGILALTEVLGRSFVSLIIGAQMRLAFSIE